MALPLQWSSSAHDNQSCRCPHKEKGRASVGLFLQTIGVFVRRRGLSVRRACLPLGVPSCQARQSSWLHEGLALSRSIGVAATCHIKTKASSFVRACERALAWHFFFFLLPSATPAAWGLRCGVSVVNCCFFLQSFFSYFPPKLFIPATLALTRCLSGWNSSGLKAQSWQQATTHQLGSAVTERRKQKMRYKVTRGRGTGGWGSATALEPHSLSPPEPPRRLSKKGILGCSGFSLWPRWLVVTQATGGCVIARLHPVHICLFEEWGSNLKVKRLPHPNCFLLPPCRPHGAHESTCSEWGHRWAGPSLMLIAAGGVYLLFSPH